MKNQALTRTLAVLLVVSLSAIVALVVSSEVIGAQTVADAPAAISISVPADQPVELGPIADGNAITPTEDTTTPSTTPGTDPSTDPSGDDTVEPDPTTTGDDTVEPDVIALPCDEGFTRIDGVCVPNFLLDPDVIALLCDEGSIRIGDVCVPNFFLEPDLLIRGLELATDG